MATQIGFHIKKNMPLLFLGFLVCSTLRADDVQDKQGVSEYYFLYDIFLDGTDIGDSRTQVEQRSDGGYSFFEQAHIQTSGWWGILDIHSSRYEIYSKQGQLLEVDEKVLDGNKGFWQQAQSSGEKLWISSSEIEDITKEEEKQLTGFTAFTSGLTPNVGEVTSVFQLLFSDREMPSESVQFSNQDFDTSFDNLPFYWAKKGHVLPGHVRVFDSEYLNITQYTVTQLDDHFRLQADQGKPMDLWFAINTAGIPHFTQVIGEGENGSFHIKLKQGKRQ